MAPRRSAGAPSLLVSRGSCRRRPRRAHVSTSPSERCPDREAQRVPLWAGGWGGGRGRGRALSARAGPVGDAVVLRELLIQKRVVGAPELNRVAVVAQLTEQEQ